MKNYKEIINEAESIVNDATKSSNTKIIAAAAIGLAAGAVLGILLAPASGSDTRSTLADSLGGAGSSIKDKAKQGFDKLSELGTQAIDAVKGKVQNGSFTESGATV